VSARVVLIVEDNEQNMELASFLLEEAGYVVRQANSADEARRALAVERPDIVLMDMNLAGADGLSIVDELRRDATNAELPVLALTAHAMRGDRERFLEGGCDGYLAKPIDVKTFVRDVEAALRQGRQAHGG
jgi:two-component system, cell cycle response regulator DivK